VDLRRQNPVDEATLVLDPKPSPRTAYARYHPQTGTATVKTLTDTALRQRLPAA